MTYSSLYDRLGSYVFCLNYKVFASVWCPNVYYAGNVYLVTAGRISVAMDTTEELFGTDEEHSGRENKS